MIPGTLTQIGMPVLNPCLANMRRVVCRASIVRGRQGTALPLGRLAGQDPNLDVRRV